ncbi:hypothetical protein [Chitinophaga pinensis]|uniref:YD repeat-containing protein n=1 Tax=Chitinophaga pinensis TaxID=79329 RepID=A0A5C6LKC7_9BACT|nr:hypothetical protein [Chitinophaga pinensis]TWV93616.1 hypothetical protein FEF09_27000 [Chitinophaga pinensis]
MPIAINNATYTVSYWTRNANPYSIAGTVAGYPLKGSTINQWTYYEHRIAGVSSLAISGTGYIDDLRVYPVNSRMVSYTTEPLLGVTSESDITSKPTFYEFDAFGRLRVVRGFEGNIMKVLDYQYQRPVTE